MNKNIKIIGAVVVAAIVAFLLWFVVLKEDNSILPGIAVSSAIDGDDPLYKAGKIADHMIGNVDAKVTIVEYASLTCPHCANFHDNTFKKFKTNYIDTGKVNFIYRNFHLDQLALAGAMLAECAPKDQYFNIVDLIFSNQQTWVRAEKQFDAMLDILKLVGYTDEKADECFANKDIVAGLLDDRKYASEVLNVASTPTLFINGVKQEGGNTGYTAFAATVDALLAE